MSRKASPSLGFVDSLSVTPLARSSATCISHKPTIRSRVSIRRRWFFCSFLAGQLHHVVHNLWWFFLCHVPAHCEPRPDDIKSAISSSHISHIPLKRIIPFPPTSLLCDTDRTWKPKSAAAFACDVLVVKTRRCFLETLRRYPVKVLSLCYHYDPIDLNIAVTVLMDAEMVNCLIFGQWELI